MSASALVCPHCRRPWSALTAADLAGLTACPECQQALQVTVLSAFGRPPSMGQAGLDRVSEADAACFFHPGKRAEAACDQCGRYVCALCQLELDGRTSCPACLAVGSRAEGDGALGRARFRWDLLTGVLIVVPLMTVCLAWLTPLTCLIAVLISLWKMNSVASRMHQVRVRLQLALVAAVGLGVASTIAIYLLLRWNS